MKYATQSLLIVSLAFLFAAGCNPKIHSEEGHLTLTFDKGPSAGATGSSPLAVGAKLDYSAHLSDEEHQKVSFRSAVSDDESAIRVEQIDGGLMRLEGVGEGEAMVDVDATGPGGEAIAAAFSLSTATVEGLDITHPCAPEAHAVYLVDHDIRLHYKMRAGNRLAVGFGHYPVEIAPAEGAELGETTTNGLLPLRTGGAAQVVNVTAEVGDEEFELRLIEEADINGMTIFEEEFDLPASAGGELELHLLPTVEGLLSVVEGPVPVCQSDIQADVTTDSPDTCTVAYGPSESEKHNLFRLYEPNVLQITGQAEGTCEFTVSLPGAAGGQGVEKSFQVDVVAGADRG